MPAGKMHVDELEIGLSLVGRLIAEQFRATLRLDDATWARGRGWALSVGLIALPYYQTTNSVLAEISRYAISEVLNDHKRHGDQRCNPGPVEYRGYDSINVR